MFSSSVTTMLTTAKTRALASCGDDGVNVVPISMIRVNDNTIWLFDFFMDKTAQNIIKNPAVALSVWIDMKGLQVKANTTYRTSGEAFEEAVLWVKEKNPARVVKGLIELTPTKIYDISPGGEFSESDLVI